MHELNEMAKRTDLQSNFKEKGKTAVKNRSSSKTFKATNTAAKPPTSPKEIKIETDGYQDLVGQMIYGNLNKVLASGRLSLGNTMHEPATCEKKKIEVSRSKLLLNAY